MAAPTYDEDEPELTKFDSTSLGNVDTESRYHRLFASPDADVILRSTDGILFRMHSYTLRTTSGLFHAMFSLPQPSTSPPEDFASPEASSSSNESMSEPESPATLVDNEITTYTELAETESECIPTHESSQVLIPFLLLLSGRPVPQPISKWASNEGAASDSPYGLIERVLNLAETWDAAGPIAAIRPALTDPELVRRDPLRLYAIACHFGWKEERQLASTYTLGMDLMEDEDDKEEGEEEASAVALPSIWESLARLSSKDLLPLLALRRKRRDLFRVHISSQERFTAGNSPSYHCTRCAATEMDNRTWYVFRQAMVMEMDRRPLGNGIMARQAKGIDMEMGPTESAIAGGTSVASKKSRRLGVMSWPEADACWAATCLKDDCGGLNYDRTATLKQIRSCLEALPMHVDEMHTVTQV